MSYNVQYMYRRKESPVELTNIYFLCDTEGYCRFAVGEKEKESGKN